MLILVSQINLNNLYLHHEFIHWHPKVLTQLPFELKLTMPPLDKRTRGYTPRQIKDLQETVGGE